MDDKNYIKRIAGEIRARTKVSPHSENLDNLFDAYANLVIAKGALVTNEDVHVAWLAWATEYEPESRWIKPYDELDDDVKDEDTQFTKAIKAVSASMHVHSVSNIENRVY